jgi:hypothetical protein
MVSPVGDPAAHVRYVVDGAPTVRAAQFLADVLSCP